MGWLLVAWVGWASWASWISPLQGAAAGPSPPELARLGLDELVDRLPPAGEETRWVAGAWRTAPEVAELRARIDAGAEPTPAQWSRALRRSRPVRLRERWPAGVPLVVGLRRPAWLSGWSVRVTARLPASDASATVLHEARCGLVGAEERLELGLLPPGTHRLVFDVVVDERDPPGPWIPSLPGLDARPRRLGGGELAFDVEVVGSVDEALPPLATPEVDAAVRRSLGLAFADWADGPAVLLVADPDVTGDPLLATLALSLRVEVREGETVTEVRRLAPSDRDELAVGSSAHAPRSAAQTFGFVRLATVPFAARDHPGERSIRVTGTSEGVLPAWDATARWGGTLEVPLAELIERERALAPGGRAWSWSPFPR